MLTFQIESNDPLRDELLAAIKSWGVNLPQNCADDDPLMTTGLFDSLAIFNLVLWVEAKTGRKLEPSKTDILKEWNSIFGILAYVHDGGKPSHSAQAAPPSGDGVAGNTAIRLIKYEPKFKSKIAAFQVRLWCPSPALNAHYFEWKYERNPYIEKPLLYLALNGDELIGMRGFYGSLWELGSDAKQHVIPVADDLLIHDDYRNQGLVTKLMEYALRDLSTSDFSHVFNLSGSPVTVLGSLTMGWRATRPLELLGRRKMSYALRRRMQKFIRRTPVLWRYAAADRSDSGASPFACLDRQNPQKVLNGMNIEVATKPKSTAMAALIRKIGYDGRLRHVRNAEFFQWKLKNPLHEYRFFYAGSDRLLGYLILKASSPPRWHGERVSLVDLEGVDAQVKKNLLRAAIDYGNFDELTLWGAAFDTAIRDEITAMGFVPEDEKKASLGVPCILVKPNDVSNNWCLDETDLLDLSHWDMRMLYTMAG